MPLDTFQKKIPDTAKKCPNIGSYFIKAEDTVTAQQ